MLFVVAAIIIVIIMAVIIGAAAAAAGCRCQHPKHHSAEHFILEIYVM